MIEFELNGRQGFCRAEPDTPLLWRSVTRSPDRTNLAAHRRVVRMYRYTSTALSRSCIHLSFRDVEGTESHDNRRVDENGSHPVQKAWRNLPR